MNGIINIGILDDDDDRITILKGVFKRREFSKKLQGKYDTFKTNLIKLELTSETTIESIINQIEELKIDCMLIDYRLNSQKSIQICNGVCFAKELTQKYDGFPLLILTSYEEDLFSKEIFHPYKVIRYDEFSSDILYRRITNDNIIELVLNYRRENSELKEKMLYLLSKKGENVKVDTEILVLDSKLEKRINGCYSLPYKTKVDLQSNRLEELFKKIDSLLEER